MTKKSAHELFFSQRVGKMSLPEPMSLEHISEYFRNRVWRIIDIAIREQTLNENGHTYKRQRGTFVKEIIVDYTVDVLLFPHDHYSHTATEQRELLRKIILKLSYDVVLTLIEFIVRHQECPRNLLIGLPQIFEDVPVAYFIQDIDGTPTITPRNSEQSGQATQVALATIDLLAPSGAKSHLRKAAECITGKTYADAVRESIHVVESVARTINPSATGSLGPALDALEQQGVLKHPALKAAFKMLYGYTSDENGIRHALLETGAADVDLDDAVFMFTACAAFSAYLLNKCTTANSK